LAEAPCEWFTISAHKLGDHTLKSFFLRNDAALTPWKDNSFGIFGADDQGSGSIGNCRRVGGTAGLPLCYAGPFPVCMPEQTVYDILPGPLHGRTGCGIREEG
jgi:hypothetical protein